MKHIILGSLLALSITQMSAAQTIQLPQQYNLDLKTAELLAQHAEQACQNQFHKHLAVAVLDGAGLPLIVKRHESVGPHNATAAQKKAFTALSTKTATTIFSQNARQSVDSQNLTTVPELLLLGGGFPIQYQDEIVGAIGVAGSGGSKNDDWCAEQAIKMTFK
ncbi:GlcG/HbpS family heme-binding protein [Acinetobacter ihumii]|uniref:GlcG/HbpS family heme-binding protein n=1 Tax=Acinetobacter ihumii TaxID=2483802 RepID=UPI001032639B|nr:heme-binding protein [Acinetobacter ihumii]